MNRKPRPRRPSPPTCRPRGRRGIRLALFRRERRWLAITALLLAGPFGLGAANSVSARLNTRSAPLGGNVTLTLAFTGAAPPNAPALPDLPGLRQIQVSRSTGATQANGRSVPVILYNYLLTTTQPGPITIPSMRVQVNGEMLNTPSLALLVSQPTSANAETSLAFIELTGPDRDVYIGERFEIETRFYWRDVYVDTIPDLNATGFSLGPPALSPKRSVNVNGQLYIMVVIQQTAAAATTGRLTLGPATKQLRVRVSGTNRRPGNNGPFRTLTVASKTQTVNALPLPSDPPPSFNGAVGSYRLTVQASPTNLNVGDPITLRVQIQGNGVLESLTLPPQANWREDDFKTYPPTSTLQILDALGLQGAKSFEQVVIPRNHEITSLPPVEFSYFDVRQGRYLTLSNQPVPLVVHPATDTVRSLPMLTNNPAGRGPERAADDILHIRPELGVLHPSGPPLVARPAFLLLQTVPVFAWLGLLMAGKRRNSLAGDSRRRRQRDVARRVEKGLKNLELHAVANESEAFYALLFRLLQEQLGDRLDLPATTITEEAVTERLAGHDHPEALLDDLQQLFLLCNQARYATGPDGTNLNSVLEHARKTLRELQGVAS